MKTLFPIRLKQARIMQGLSMESLCERINHELSKQSLSKYENGQMLPDSKSLILLSNALNVNIDYFFRPQTIEIEKVEFRKKSKLAKKQILTIQEVVKDKLERYFEIELILDMQSNNRGQYKCEQSVLSDKDIYPLVANIKDKWRLGEDGINNLIEILEENGIKVIEIDASIDFDGLCGVANEDKPFIVLNMNFDSERKRFTALHELGHLLLNFDSMLDEKDVEKYCNLFASEMLVSKEVFLEKIGPNRSDISMQELIPIQKQFGISIDALMYKAKELNIITDNRYKTYCKKKNASEIFKSLVNESRYKTEQSFRFERLVYRALASEIISISKAGVLLNESVDKVRNMINLV